MSTQKVTDPVIEAISSTVLTGAFPVLDGSSLTGIAGFVDTTNASDPATDTNPGTGVGTVWVNSTSGEVFVCTDATTDANGWTNIGAGTGNVEPWSFGGTNYGFIAGGWAGNSIWRFSLTSDGNATDWADITQGSQIEITSGAHSETHGYTHGGRNTASSTSNVIEKFPFASQTNATDIADLTRNRRLAEGHTTPTHGYSSGGHDYSTSPLQCNTIDKHEFATDGNATDHGDLTVAREAPASASSSTHGYVAGGSFPPYNVNNTQNVIDRFVFANNANATDWADLDTESQYCAGTSSTTHGYCSGGYSASSNSSFNIIQKYSFASNANATDVADLTVARAFVSGVSGTTHGYSAGGESGAGSHNQIDKFTFASDDNATDVGDINHGLTSSVGIED